MKKIINNNIKVFSLAFLLISVTFSCADLDEDPTEVIISPEALVSVETLRDVISSVYTRTFQAARWSDYHLAAYAGDDLTTESGLNSGNKQDFRSSDWRTQTSTEVRPQFAYRECYKIIAAANVPIRAADDIVSGDLELKDWYLGEAHFLRAYAYMHLTRTYGKVPLVLENFETSPESVPKAEILDIYQAIEADLIIAEAMLPDTYPGLIAIGARPSKGAAKAFLARLYLHWGGFPLNDTSKYALAATKAKEVIDGGYGYGLSDSMRKMWTLADQYNHNESVFSLIAATNLNGGLGNRTVGRLGLVREAGGWQETFGEIAFYEDMEADATAQGTITRFNDTYVHEMIPRGTEPLGADWRTWSDPHPILRKVASGDMSEGIINSTNSSLIRYIMRYSEVLLTYAEASGRSGSATADAWEALNKVRRRAAGLDPNTPDAGIDLMAGDLAELAYTESKWEFAGEYERWYDLQRMQRFTDPAHVRRSPEEPVDVQNNRIPETSGEFLYFTPIPQIAIDVNPSLAD